jgi:uncharacterized protein (DUF2249 family)
VSKESATGNIQEFEMESAMLIQPGEYAIAPTLSVATREPTDMVDGAAIKVRSIGNLLKRQDASPDREIVADDIASASGHVFPCTANDLPGVDLGDLVQRLVAAFRRHPHISNVMTHISGAKWERIEQALRAILDPSATQNDLAPLARNIVELMWAERGVTGRILKPYLHELFAGILPRPVADRLLGHIADLCGRQAPLPSHRRGARVTERTPITNERLVDVREIKPRVRHTVIFQLFERLDETNSLQLITDHDPRPLHLQLEAQHGSHCEWIYLEQGPDVWRVRLHRRDRAEVRS